MVRLALFASGGGSNAKKIVEYFHENDLFETPLIVTNRRSAGVLSLANEYDISSMVIDKSYFYDSKDILKVLKNEDIDFIILAGFLLLIPTYLIKAYPNKILNIHPALLPKYGGKGMYGIHVHRAVKEAGDKVSGPTIHLVNEHYDEGEILFQDQCEIHATDSPEDIAAKVLSLEHQHYAKAIENYVKRYMTDQN